MITLNATKRTETGRASRALSADGFMPAVVYGPSHEAESVTVSLSDFTKILRDEGESTVIEIAGLGTNFQVLIHAIDRDPVTSVPRHADFYAIKKGAKVTVSIPVSFVGESAAVKGGASMVTVMRELEVESDPSKLPHEVEVDVSVLAAIGDQIRVGDIKLPAGVTATADAEEVVALIQEVTQESDEPAEALDMSAIEVEQKGKDEEDTPAEAAGE